MKVGGLQRLCREGGNKLALASNGTGKVLSDSQGQLAHRSSRDFDFAEPHCLCLMPWHDIVYAVCCVVLWSFFDPSILL